MPAADLVQTILLVTVLFFLHLNWLGSLGAAYLDRWL